MEKGTMERIISIINNTNESFAVKDKTNKHCDDDYDEDCYMTGFPDFNKGKHKNYGVFLLNGAGAGCEFDLYLVFSDYNDGNGRRMHIYTRSEKYGLGEFHKEKNYNNQSCLTLKYSPCKRDGKNPERKKIFTSIYGGLEVYLPINDNFIEELFRYAECRYKAHYLTD